MKRKSFEDDVQRLVGLQLKQIRYYELQGDWPSWNAHPNWDSVAQGIDLIGHDASYIITWDATFWNYGLRVSPGIMVDFLSAGQFTDVSDQSRWSDYLGQRVRAARLMWEPVPEPFAGEGSVYPQHVVLTFEAGGQVYLSAAKPQGTQAPFLNMSDYIVIVFDQEVAQHHLPGVASDI